MCPLPATVLQNYLQPFFPSPCCVKMEESTPPSSFLSESGGGEQQGEGRGRVWQHSLPFTVEDSVCSEPHLEVDREEEPKIVPVQETGQI